MKANVAARKAWASVNFPSKIKGAKTNKFFTHCLTLISLKNSIIID